MPGLKLLTAATASAITVAEAKVHCGIEADDWDDLLTSYIAAATGMAEDYSGQAICPQTWQLSLDDFGNCMPLIKGPVTEVTSIAYRDDDGVEQTLDPSIYVTDLVSWPARIVLDANSSWPSVDDNPNAVTITFVTGYESVPEAIKMAIRMTVAAWFATRTMGDLPQAARDILFRYRRIVI